MLNSMPVFIYCLKDPTTGDVRYIGQTNRLKRRLAAHLRESAKESNHLGNWLRSLKGEKPVLTVLHEVAENESWQEEERRYIFIARGMGVDLVNSTDGGEGSPGRIFSPEQRAAVGNRHRGGTHSPEHCAAIGAASKEMWGDPEYRKQQTKSRKAAWTPERRAALRAVMDERTTPEYCATQSAWWTPERRAVKSAQKTGVPWSPARRAAYERRWGSK